MFDEDINNDKVMGCNCIVSCPTYVNAKYKCMYTPVHEKGCWWSMPKILKHK
jgi:hypothetical protein